MNEYINVTSENLEKEHICCAGNDANRKKCRKSVFSDGFVFRKLNAGGKAFIQYEPIETAWVPIEGKNYEYIHCLWVDGGYKEKGVDHELLTYAISDAREKGRSGICTLIPKKEHPFIGGEKFYVQYGFEEADSIGEFELLALHFEDGDAPKICDSARAMRIPQEEFTVYYSIACPYVECAVKELTEYAKERQITIRFVEVDTLEKVKKVPCIFNNWANFYKGEFVSDTILNANSFEKLFGSKNM